MEKIGTVCKATDKTVDIRINRDSACGENCAACGLCKNSKEMIFSAVNSENLAVGDEVIITLDDSIFLKQSAIGYLSLTALIIIGAAVGNLIGGDFTAFFGGIIALLSGILIFRKAFKQSSTVNIRKITR